MPSAGDRRRRFETAVLTAEISRRRRAKIAPTTSDDDSDLLISVICLGDN